MMMLSDLPTELLYTILSHRLGDIVFQYLFLDALVADGQSSPRWQAHFPPIAEDSKLTSNTLGPLSEIISLASVCASWRSVLARILGALLALDSGKQNDDENTVPSLSGRLTAANHMTSLTASSTITRTGKHAPHTSLVTFRPILSLQTHHSDHPIGVASYKSTIVTLYPIQPYVSTLRMMQRSLRTLIQHSMDMYKEEQEASNGFVGTTGVVTPPHPGTLTPTPTFTPTTSIVSTGGGTPLQANITGNGSNGQTQLLIVSPAPLTPLTLLPRILEEHEANVMDEPSDMFAPPTLSPSEVSRLADPSLDFATSQTADSTSGSFAVDSPLPSSVTHDSDIDSDSDSRRRLDSRRRHWVWGTNPLFNEALGYTQSSLFTCSRSSTHRSDLSLALTVGRLQGALELLDRICHDHNGCDPMMDRFGRAGGMVRPKEVAEVIRCGVEGARQRVQEALQVCEWNDLLDRVFLRGERSDELIERVPICFDSMEDQARSIQMLHLLRSGLFKTTQTVGRMSAIALYPSTSSFNTGGLDHSAQDDALSVRDGDGATGALPGGGAGAGGGAAVTVDSRLSLPKEWKARAANLSMLWTGRVIEWTGF